MERNKHTTTVKTEPRQSGGGSNENKLVNGVVMGLIFTDRVSQEGNAIGSVCLSVRPLLVSYLYLLNRVTFDLDRLQVYSIRS